jgi:hypothetical protein
MVSEKEKIKRASRDNRALYMAVKKIIYNGMNPERKMRGDKKGMNSDYLRFDPIVLNHNNPAFRPGISIDYSKEDEKEMRERLHLYLNDFMNATFKDAQNNTSILVFPVDDDYIWN